MTIRQQPNSLSLTGNIKDFIVESADLVRFRLLIGGSTIVDELYTPNSEGRMHISLGDILDAELSLVHPGTIWITEQPNIVREFTAILNDTSIPFTVLRGGIDSNGILAGVFLRQNFLTGQPAHKLISREQPEYLSYYATESCVLKISTGSVGKTIANMTAGKAYLFNLSYEQVKYLTSGTPDSFSVWVEFPNLVKSNIQHYEYVNKLGPDEEYFLWENGLGGLDVARFTGQSTFSPKQTHNLGLFQKLSKEYRTDILMITSKNTGHKRRDEYMWIYDFLMRKNRYKYVNGRLQPIVLEKSTLNYPSHEYVSAYVFDYRFSDSKPYLQGSDEDVDTKTAYWLNYRCQQAEMLEYLFTFSNGDTQQSMTINESGQSIAVGVISERSGLAFDSVSIEDVPAWLTVSKNGLTYTFTAGENTAGDREAAVVFRQGESGKTITLNLSQASNIKDIEIHADYDNIGKRFALDALSVPVASNLTCTLEVAIQRANGTIDAITITGMLNDGIAHSDYDYTAIGIPNDAIVLEVKTFTISPDSDSRYVYLPVKPKPTLFVRINTRTATIDPYNMQSQAFLENPQTGERVNAEQIITAKITITADNVTGFPISELTRELTLPIPSGSSQSAVRKPSFVINEKGAYSGAKNATMVTLESSGYKYYAYSEALLKDDRYFIQLGRATYLPPTQGWSQVETTALSERPIDVNTSSGTPLSALGISCNAYCLYLDADRQNIEEYVNLIGGDFNLSIPYGQTQSTEQSDSLDIDTSRVYEILLVGAEYSASGYTGSSEVAVLRNQHLLRSVGQAIEMDGKKVQLQYFLFSLPFAKLQTNIRISQTASVTFTSGGVQQVLTFTHDFYLTYMEANLGDKRTDSVVLPDSLPVSDDDTYTVEVVTTIEASKPERFYLDNIILIN